MNLSELFLVSTNKCESPVARFICIPYSGGNVHAYTAWIPLMPSKVDLWTVQLPGRGFRFNEPLPRDLIALGSTISRAIEQLPRLPTVLFGHSLGGLLCYEVALGLEALSAADTLKHIFISGCRSPGYHAKKPFISSTISDEQIIKMLRRYRATPPELLDDAVSLGLFLPALRSDLEMISNYRPSSLSAVKSPVTIFAGARENISNDELNDWSSYAGEYFSTHRFSGGHFYINSNRKSLMRKILEEVETTTGFQGTIP